MQYLWFFIGQTALILMAFVAGKIRGEDSAAKIQSGDITSGIFLGGRLVVAGVLVTNPISQSDSIVTFVVMFPLGWIFVQFGKYMLRAALWSSSQFEFKEDGAALTFWQVVVQGIPFKARDPTKKKDP